jgi:glycosyltransferase involved in cell wall biosynthesis
VKLSVVIPTRNKREPLARTLAALRRQTGAPEPWEIIVVDDASDDGTDSLLAELSRQPASRLLVVSCPENVGRAAARNRGVRAASGTWVLFLDDDIVAPPGLLAAHHRLLETDPKHGTIGRVATDPAIVDAPHFHYIDGQGVAKIRAGPVPARYFVTQNAAVPREALLVVGGFDERFRAYGFEDAEIAFRLEEMAGLRFLPLHDPVPLHVHHHTLTAYLDKKRECGRASVPRLARLHPDRLRQMHLDWVVDPPEACRTPFRIRSFRALASSPAALALERSVARWPTTGEHRPRAGSWYRRCLDLLILCAYRQGLVERRRPGA